MKPVIRYFRHKKRLAKHKYILLETDHYKSDFTGLSFHHERFQVHVSGHLTCRVGYTWDGPSGPAIDTENFMRGSMYHDMLYQAIESAIYYHKNGALFPMNNEYRKELRQKADVLLRKICIEDGMWKIRAWWVYFGVRTFARRHAGVKR